MCMCAPPPLTFPRFFFCVVTFLEEEFLRAIATDKCYRSRKYTKRTKERGERVEDGAEEENVDD